MSTYPDQNSSNLRHRIASYQMKKAFLTAKRQSEETVNREYESAEAYAFDEAETNAEETLSSAVYGSRAGIEKQWQTHDQKGLYERIGQFLGQTSLSQMYVRMR